MRYSRYFIQYMLCVVFFFMTSCEKDDTEPEKVRTLMVYLVGQGDSNISGYLKSNIRDMAKGWKKSYNGNIVIFYDANNAAPQLLTFKIKKGVAEEEVIKTYDDDLNSASAETLNQVIKEMQALYPAESYAMIFGGHASGWLPPSLQGRSARSLFRWENSITRSFADASIMAMDIRDMAKAIPERLDFILFDACLMSSIEALYEFRDKAKYIIASPTETPIIGYPYSEVIPYFWSKGDQLEKDLKETCRVYYEFYNTYSSADRFGTVALVNMTELTNLYALTREILSGRASDAAKMNGSEVYSYPKVQYGKCDRFFDLREYMRFMTNDASLLSAYQEQLDKVVLYKAATNPFYYKTIPDEMFSGIATYIPRAFWGKETDAYWSFPWAGVYDRDATE